jgi:hypothetical protein
MNLIDDWKAKFPALWSVRFALLSAFFGVAEMVLPQLQSFIPPLWFAGLSVVTALAAAVSRIIAQPGVFK